LPEETLAGALLALLTAFCWALTSVLLRRVKDAVKPFQSAFISSVIGVLAVLGLAAALRELPNLFNIGLTSVI
jgi:drug/metabolite transporter (DMT)-like permease